MTGPDPPPAAEPAGLPDTPHALLDLARRAQAGDEAAVPALREVLKRPGLVEALGGDLAGEAVRALVGKYAGKDLLIRETIMRKLDQMRAELGGDDPSPLERLLVERIVATWLHLHHVEILYAGKELSVSLAMYYQKAIDRAQKRYIAAIKALATVRRLALPALQINVARRQVNVAGSVVTASGAN